MIELTSAPVPPAGPADHVRGTGPEATVYLDLACPRCALAWSRLRDLPLRLVLRHFPIASKHPRAPVLHAAAEAAGLQDRFVEMWDSLLADQARQDDPHLWERAEELRLELERFERDRRSDQVAAHIRGDFADGIRAGVTGTPAFFVDSRPAAEADLRSLAGAGGDGSSAPPL
jgi:protein-disulfide isomerase